MANPQKENGHLDIANELVEVLLKTALSGGEFRLFFAVLRKTWAWHKKQDWISLSQLAKMTNFSRRYICKLKKQLIDKKLLLEKGKYLMANKNYDEWVVNKKTLGSELKGNEVVNKKTHTKETMTKETNTKEITTKVVKAITPYGNKEVNEFMNFFKQKFGLRVLDGSEAINRRYAWLAIKKCCGLANALKVIELACQDDFYGDKIADVKKFYYHMVEITKKITNKKGGSYTL